MITITIGVTRSKLSDYIDGLDEAMSCFYEGYFFSPRYRTGAWDGKIHFLSVPFVTFPTGLLFMVEEFLNGKNIEYKIVDQRIMSYVKDIPVDRINILGGITLRDYQLEAVDRAFKAQCGVLELPTGSGKTEIAAALIKLIGVKTLFLVHTQDLLRQTIKRFKERIGLEIGCIGDGEFDVEGKDIIVATVQSIHRWLDNEPDKSRKFLDSFQMLFQDECHHSSAKCWERIGMLCKNAYFRFGLSGTILRRDVLSNLKMLALFGAPIYRLPTMGLIEQGFLSDIDVRIIEREIESPAFSLTWAEVYQRDIVYNKSRNDKIADIAEEHCREGKRVMILIRKIQHGSILQELLYKRNVPVRFLHGQIDSGKRETTKAEFNEDLDSGRFVLIASTIFNEGVDIPEVQVIIIAGGGKSEVQTIQRVGRGLRLKSSKDKLILYDFADHGKFLGSHAKKRIKTYKQEGFLK